MDRRALRPTMAISGRGFTLRPMMIITGIRAGSPTTINTWLDGRCRCPAPMITAFDSVSMVDGHGLSVQATVLSPLCHLLTPVIPTHAETRRIHHRVMAILPLRIQAQVCVRPMPIRDSNHVPIHPR